jgi:nitroreductase
MDGGYDFDTGRVAQNLMLAAAAIGLGSCPVTLHDDAAARLVLRLPDDAYCRYAVALGYENKQAEQEGRQEQRSRLPVGRKPLDELAHRNHWTG